MRRRRWVTGTGAVLALLAGASGARAQFDLQVLDGGKPVPDVRVTVVREGARTTLPGATGADGSFDLSVLDFGKGTRLDVWKRQCVDGRVELILAEEGTTGVCVDEGQRAGDDCSCEKIGVAIWDGSGWVVDIGIPGGPGAIQPIGAIVNHAPPLAFGFGGGFNIFPNLKDVVGDQPNLASSDVSSSAPFVEAALEHRVGRQFVVGTDFTYNFFDTFTQTFNPVNGGPTSSQIDYDVMSAGLYGAWRPRPCFGGLLGLFFGFGGEYVWNVATVTTRYPGILVPVMDERSESGLQGTVRTGFDWYFNERSSLRLGATYSRGESDRADERVGLEAKFMWNL
ncbi:MAG TPA: hypothetical protein VM778_03500, partial [Gemmatimonadota bacterium]|nr:hypothetical protein [Gemmatimonadota bacterium]